MSTSRRAALGLILAPLLAAPSARASASPLGLLGRPGVHAVMRHALAPGTGDPPGMRLDDPATQRRLDDRGRAQARAAGAAIRAAGGRVDRVLSSAWDRCVETARLMDLGPVTVEPALNSFFEDRSTRDAQTAATLALLRRLSGESVLCVTHQVNVTALTGVYPASGEIVVVRLGDGIEVLGRVRA